MHIKKIILTVLCLSLCLCVCSCTFINNAVQETKRVAEFTVDFSETLEVIVSSGSAEEIEAQASQLIHPSSDLTVDTLIDKFKNNEKLQGIDFDNVTEDSIQVENIGVPELSSYSEELGGNIYSLEVTVSVDGTPITLDLTLLSNESGMGFYDFEIK